MSIVGIPILYWSGTEGDLNIMVIELLGNSLNDEIKLTKKPLPLLKVFYYGHQLVFFPLILRSID